MKATLAKDLVIGAIYSDISSLNSGSTLLRYEKKARNRVAFSYVGGPDSYRGCKSKDGLIRFGIQGLPFHELSPSEIEQYLPKEKP